MNGESDPRIRSRMHYCTAVIRDCLDELQKIELAERRLHVRHGVSWTKLARDRSSEHTEAHAALATQAAAAKIMLSNLPSEQRARMAETLLSFAETLVASMRELTADDECVVHELRVSSS